LPPPFNGSSTRTFVTASVTGASASIEAAWGTGVVGGDSAQLTFRPSASSVLEMHADGPLAIGGEFDVTLRDLTSATTLFSFGTGDLHRDTVVKDFESAVDSSHTYLLFASVETWAGYTYGLGDMTLRAVPDSSSTALLLGIALIGLALIQPHLGYRSR
jgi:hypothetical protein